MSNDNSSGSTLFDRLRKPNIVRQDSKWLGGVSAGISERFNLDVVLVRGLFVALSLLGGAGLLIYGLAWALLPDTNGHIHLEEAVNNRGWSTGLTGAVIMVALGIFPAPWVLNWAAPVLWPVVIIAAILFILFSRKNTKFAARPNRPEKPGAESTAGFSAPTPQPTPASTVEIPWRDPAMEDFAAPTAKATEDSSPTEVITPPKDSSTAPTETLYSAGFASTTEGSFQTSRPLTEEEKMTSESKKPYFEPPKNPEHRDPDFAWEHPAARKARQSPALPGWVATTVVGVTILAIAMVLSMDYLDVVNLPGNGWGIALAAGLLIVGFVLVCAAFSRRTSGGLLGLAIPLLVLTVIFGGNSFNSSTSDLLRSSGNSNEYNAVFSNAKIDLSQMKNLEQDKEVKVDALFAKVELELPWNAPVKIETDGVFNSAVNGPLPQDLIDFPEGVPVLTVKIDGVFSSLETSVAPAGITSPDVKDF